MKQLYTAVLKAMSGEFEAFQNLKQGSEKRFMPLFDIPTPLNRDAAAIQAKGGDINSTYLRAKAEKIKRFYKTGDSPVMFDMFYWSVDDIVQTTGESVYEFFFKELTMGLLFNIPIIPVISLDKWDSQEYRNAMKNIVLASHSGICIRCDIAHNDDFIDMDEIEDVLSFLAIPSSKCRLIFDLGYILEKDLGDLLGQVESLYMEIKGYNFYQVMTCGSSMPKSITTVVAEQNSENEVQRKEMLLWKALTGKGYDITFADYGTRHPLPEPESDSIENPKQPFFQNKNKQIRYTTLDAHYILRGCPTKDGGNHQALSKKLTKSPCYSGSPFSWSDQRISECSQGSFKGNDSNWVAIDTNRHIEAVLDEVKEHLRTPVVTDAGTLEEGVFVE
ncbi:MAG: Unknown protein [uncultured Thiotrichaceae bacterium]|uniref:Uncharacterized protein n=1 Tax=uncultured Thiotrichaceae bacterium TaxID=298394 RepID=A0A6S6UGE8_9GAMM|nr:MAG: Unknown protein [uncultured Thiotrichaceae bacterium]